MKRSAAFLLFACFILQPVGTTGQDLFPDPLFSVRSGELMASSLEDIVEGIVTARWHIFLASGSVTHRTTSLNLQVGLNLMVGRGGAGYSEEQPGPRHGLGLLDRIDFLLQETLRLQPDDEERVFRDGAVASLENVRRWTWEAAELTRQALGEDDLNITWGNARKARDLLFLAEKGSERNQDGTLDWNKGGALKAQEAVRQLNRSGLSP